MGLKMVDHAPIMASFARASMYPQDPLARARHRAWIELATQNPDRRLAGLPRRRRPAHRVPRSAFRDKLRKLEAELSAGRYLAGIDVGVVDAVCAPLFRYFGIIDPAPLPQPSAPERAIRPPPDA
jgi:glutathione S-transferase